MPTYEYRCTKCGEHLEVVQSFRDDPLAECPNCGGALRKVFGSIGVVFKGSGFYKTDSRPAAKTSSGDSAAASPAASSDSSSAAASSDGASKTKEPSSKPSDGSKDSKSSTKAKAAGSSPGSAAAAS